MIIAMAVVNGFKSTIKDKTFNFWGHLQVTANVSDQLLIAQEPFAFDKALYNNLIHTPGVLHVTSYGLGSAIISTPTVNEGIKLKGVDNNFRFASNNAIQFKGDSLLIGQDSTSNTILLSDKTLAKIDGKIGDAILVYFLDISQNTFRIRKLKIAGTYHTGIEEIDNSFGICDIDLIRKIYNWPPTAINGYQVQVADYKNAEQIAATIFDNYLIEPLSIMGIEDIYPHIFQWLDFLDVNTITILSIMAIVAVINMITALLIFILERNNMIGVLKTLGMRNQAIQKIFVYHIGRIVLKGIIWGVLIGLLFCFVQQTTQFIKIDEASYYINYVPIEMHVMDIVGIIVGTFLFCILILMIPPIIIRTIPIIRTIQFK